MTAQSAPQGVTAFIERLTSAASEITFDEVMQVISDNYSYTPTSFTNGEVTNEAGTNEGSCKVFAFAQLNKLTEQQTLYCFAQYYREDVLKHPQGDDHGNIRNFIKTGWQGIKFTDEALKPA